MYQNTYFSRRDNLLYIWDDESGLEKVKYEPYAYTIDPNGEYTTLSGLSVSKVKSWTKEAVENGLIFEHDVDPTTRILVDRYYQSDEPSKNHKILFFDIEVERAEKHSLPKDAKNKITAISYCIENMYVCLLLDEQSNVQSGKQSDGTLLLSYQSEYEMLHDFVSQWYKIKPTIISGWNSDLYDIPYLVNRIIEVCGYNFAKKLSPIGILEERTISERDVTFKIAGITSMDYMELYKKFTYSEQSSYKLDAIAKKELKRGKISYEGSLDNLYKTDIQKFISYNITDVELVSSIDKKMRLIETAIGICHAGHVSYDNYQYSSKYLDGASLTYCKRNGLITISGKKELFQNKVLRSESYLKTRKGFIKVPDIIKDNTKVYIIEDEEYIEAGIFFNKKQKRNSSHLILQSGKAIGAAVKIPAPGIYQYIIDLDLTSLYPSLIRTLNASPETLFGKIENWDEHDYINKTIDTYIVNVYKPQHEEVWSGKNPELNIPKNEIWKFISDNNLSIASNGVLYKLDKPGLLPSILTEWFNERKRLSKLAEEYANDGNDEMYRYYDMKQLIQKILLNSFYGVLLLPSFRFYNKDIGESVTVTGQSVIKFSINVVNRHCNEILNTQLVDYVIVSDTDSIFLSPYKIINPNSDNIPEEELINRTLKFAKEIQTIINESYDVYCSRLHNVNAHHLNIKQEMIAKTGFFLSVKKRYALHIINKKGVKVDEYEIKGIDVVRSSFPKVFKEFQRKIIIEILSGQTADQLNKMIREFKETLPDIDITNLLVPSSVKEISKFDYGEKGTPIHVKSAQNYNKLLEMNFEQISLPVVDGDKIMFGYVRQNPYGFETMAIKGQDEDPQYVLDFVNKFIDREEIFNRVLMGKLESIWEDLNFGKIEIEEPHNFF